MNASALGQAIRMTKIISSLPLMLVACAAIAASPLPCVYAGRGATTAMEEHANCAELVDDTLKIASRHLKAMSFPHRGVAEVWVDGRWYYVKKNGQSLNVLAIDNGPDPYSEGLTRSMIAGKIAYFDEQLRLVLRTIYDWGSPFENGRALVCSGCKASKTPSESPALVEGGLWGYIDRTGTEVVPVKFAERELSSGQLP